MPDAFVEPGIAVDDFHIGIKGAYPGQGAHDIRQLDAADDLLRGDVLQLCVRVAAADAVNKAVHFFAVLAGEPQAERLQCRFQAQGQLVLQVHRQLCPFCVEHHIDAVGLGLAEYMGTGGAPGKGKEILPAGEKVNVNVVWYGRNRFAAVSESQVLLILYGGNYFVDDAVIQGTDHPVVLELAEGLEHRGLAVHDLQCRIQLVAGQAHRCNGHVVVNGMAQLGYFLRGKQRQGIGGCSIAFGGVMAVAFYQSQGGQGAQIPVQGTEADAQVFLQQWQHVRIFVAVRYQAKIIDFLLTERRIAVFHDLQDSQQVKNSLWAAAFYLICDMEKIVGTVIGIPFDGVDFFAVLPLGEKHVFRQEKADAGEIVLVGPGIDAVVLLKILLVVAAVGNVTEKRAQGIVVPYVFI